jgi:hypothetical protein
MTVNFLARLVIPGEGFRASAPQQNVSEDWIWLATEMAIQTRKNGCQSASIFQFIGSAAA